MFKVRMAGKDDLQELTVLPIKVRKEVELV
jgi:hypothetical protein